MTDGIRSHLGSRFSALGKRGVHCRILHYTRTRAAMTALCTEDIPVGEEELQEDETNETEEPSRVSTAEVGFMDSSLTNLCGQWCGQ